MRSGGSLGAFTACSYPSFASIPSLDSSGSLVKIEDCCKQLDSLSRNDSDVKISPSDGTRDMCIKENDCMHITARASDIIIFLEKPIQAFRASAVGRRFEVIAVSMEIRVVQIARKVGSGMKPVKIKLEAANNSLQEALVPVNRVVTVTRNCLLASVWNTLNSVTCTIGRQLQPAITLFHQGKGGLLHVCSQRGKAVIYVKTAAFRGVGSVEELVRPLSISIESGYVYVSCAIRGTIICIKGRVVDAFDSAIGTAAGLTQRPRARATAAAHLVAARASSVAAQARAVVADEHFQVTAGAAASGAIALGATGGAAGLITGGALGAAAGIIPAVFTFGASIPIGFIIGGSTGLCVGTVAGGTCGLVGGGVAGYSVKGRGTRLASRFASCTRMVGDVAVSSKSCVKKALASTTAAQM
eukprot:TRINITY_DN64631_c0_g1_i1.p1 TRINITY_DN64631_c0_g1~~TRINITY_DN64631_c0_g1_i1.p1  ORF type:complete len:414 (-),score=35.36 TRINITY_DN64631_c0_g1_i1:51-1292(-)